MVQPAEQQLQNGYVQNMSQEDKKEEQTDNPVEKFAYFKRFTGEEMALRGNGGIVLRNGTYSVYKFVHNINPVYQKVPISRIPKMEEDGVDVGTIQIEDDEWDGAVPIMHATRSNVRFYDCYLDPDKNDSIPPISCKDGGINIFIYIHLF